MGFMGDPALSFTMPKTAYGAAFAAALSLLAAGPVNAADKPKMKAAYSVDSDNDGHVDGVVVTWSKKQRGGADRKAPFAFEVKGYTVTRVERARKRTQRIRIAEKPACDIGASVKVSFKRQKLDMRRFDPKVPRITCAVTRDADGDAQVDGLRLTYSRRIRNRAQLKGPFVFSAVGYRVSSVAKAKGRFLDIQLVERTTPDSGATPLVGYSRPSSRRTKPFAVRAGKRGDAYTGTFQGTRDGVSPKLLAASTGDADRDGLLDSMAVRFSEPVRADRATALNVLGMKVRSATPYAKDFLALALTENSARGDARPGVWITGEGVNDLAGNPAVRGAVAPADAAAPVIVGALTVDADGARGRIDGIRVGFSERVVHARDAGGSYPFSVTNRKVTSVEAASGRELQLRLVEATASDTGAQPAVSFTPGVGVPVTDAAGNRAVEGLKTALDGVAPVLLSGTTADGDSDGRIDQLALRFSENVQHTAETSQTSFSVDGFTVTAAGEAAAQQVTLSLQETGAADSGARPAVSYKRDGVADVRDAAGNLVGDASVAQADDGAAPVLLTASTADADDDGKLDRLRTTWSEPLVHADDAAAPFPVSATGFSVTRVHPANGTALAIDLAEPAAHDTGSTPALAYNGGADPIRDAAGLEPAKKSWNGLTLDALPPRAISATTADADADGSLDGITVRFSENVIHARETTQASFVVTGHTISSVEAASQDGLLLALQESGTGDSGARPAISYTPDGQEDVRDGAANFAPAGTIAQASDGARPVLLFAETQDGDDDGRLDGIATTWSEALDHPDDSTAPFPLSAQGFAVSRVRVAAGQSLAVDLTEPAGHDTGSAPDITYSGGADPIRDASGLEAERKTHAGLTRDALPPRLVSTSTADADFDGRLDAVELNWSEAVTGATGTGPYAVNGRTLGANVSFSGASTRVPFAEAGSGFDTNDRPAISYDAGPGDLHDIAEGVGDTAADAPAVTAQTPADRAAPILVAAKTADLSTPLGGNSPNGTLDAVLVTFSEPISHSVDGIAPFSLNVAGRTETQVEGDDNPNDRSLYVTVSEASAPDGGYKPDVSVTGSGPDADHITDRAAPANDARAMTFSGTTDEVRPVLLSAQLGERGASGGCTKTAVAGIDGQVDCVITTWSEPVKHDADGDGSYPLSSSGWSIGAAGIAQLGPSSTLDVLLAPGATPDRDRNSTTVSYNGAVDTPVVDEATPANESLDGTRNADPACRDTGQEGNDLRDAANPLLSSTSPAFERKCAFDQDWYRVTSGPTGYLQLLTRPVAGVDIELELVDGAGTVVTGGGTVAEPGGAGQIDKLTFPTTGPLADNTTYWAHVTANDTPSPQEGPYCVVFSNDFASEAGCGPLVGQLVFTEAGLGNDKFAEIKNDFDVPVEMNGAGAKLVIGTSAAGTRRECTLNFPTGGDTIIEPSEHVVIQPSASVTAFGCSAIGTIAANGERLELSANGAIDVVDLAGVNNSPVAAEHSLEFIEDGVTEDHVANDDVALKWCRTFAAHTKGAVGDGCDEYRINEVLWKPTSSSLTSDGLAFIELAGNLPALANSKLLGSWIVRGVNGLTGDGTADLVLPATASPRSNGTFVVADGVGGTTQVSDSDHIWNSLDLNSATWPDNTGAFGPRGLQLLRPGAATSPPCMASVDAFGWTSTAQGFTQPLDDLRSCSGLEGQEYTNSTVGVSAARDNLSSSGDTTYNTGFDTNQNRGDFCPQSIPNPGQLNVRPSC